MKKSAASATRGAGRLAAADTGGTGGAGGTSGKPPGAPTGDKTPKKLKAKVNTAKASNPGSTGTAKPRTAKANPGMKRLNGRAGIAAGGRKGKAPAKGKPPAAKKISSASNAPCATPAATAAAKAAKPQLKKKDMATVLALRDVLAKGAAVMAKRVPGKKLFPDPSDIEDLKTVATEAAEVKQMDHTNVATEEGAEFDRACADWHDTLQANSFTGNVWEVGVKHLNTAIDKAVLSGKSVLVVDDSPNNVTSSYLTHCATVAVAAKGLVLRKFRGTPVSELQEDLRSKLVMSMQLGYPLWLELGSAAPDFKGAFCDDDTFPYAVFEGVTASGIRKNTYGTSAVNRPAFHKKLAKEHELKDLEYSHMTGRAEGMYVIVTSTFSVEDYEEFLKKMIPLEHFQVIHPNPDP